MKLCILSRAPRCYSSRRLREAAEGRGHRVKVLDTLRFSIEHYAVWMAAWTSFWLFAGFVWLQIWWIRKAIRAYQRTTPAHRLLMQLKHRRHHSRR